MYCQTEADPAVRLRHAQDITFRGVPEWQRAFAYTPRLPQLTELNAAAWLIFDMCDGRSVAEIAAEFADSLPPGMSDEDAGRLFAEGLSLLGQAGLVVRSDTETA